jgi:hypothetical protein
MAQWLTLIVTALVGASILITPHDRDAKISVIEQAMNADYWAYGLMVFSTVALVCEIDMAARKHERWVNIVAWAHILLCGLLVGYTAAAFVGVLLRVSWNFGAPALGMLVSFWHLLFSKRGHHV